MSAGLLLRRTVPAIVVAFVAFLALRLPVEYWLRQRYQSPVKQLLPPRVGFTSGPSAVPTTPGAWVLGQDLVDRTGHPLSPALQDQIARHTQALDGTAAGDAYLRGLGLHLEVVYQPAGRFWTFQVIEASLFVGIAALLLGITIWALHRSG